MNIAVVLAVIALITGAAITVLAAISRSDTSAASGGLDRRTRTADKSTVTPRTTKEEPSGTPSGRTPAPVAVKPKNETVSWEAPSVEHYGVTRRSFLTRSVVGLMGLGIATFGVSIVAFLWPASSSGFGSKIRVGTISEVADEIDGAGGFLYRPDGRMWLTKYPQTALAKARDTYSAGELSGMEAGVVALYQKCPHLGCRVPECQSSQWFECPCHGSQYNRVGEKKGGPSPRGMDRFAVEVSGDTIIVNTGALIQGPAIGTNTTGQEAEGPNCIGASGH